MTIVKHSTAPTELSPTFKIFCVHSRKQLIDGNGQRVNDIEGDFPFWECREFMIRVVPEWSSPMRNIINRSRVVSARCPNNFPLLGLMPILDNRHVHWRTRQATTIIRTRPSVIALGSCQESLKTVALVWKTVITAQIAPVSHHFTPRILELVPGARLPWLLLPGLD